MNQIQLARASSEQADAEVIAVDVDDGFVLHYLCLPKRRKAAIGTVGEIQTELQESTVALEEAAAAANFDIAMAAAAAGNQQQDVI